LENKDLKTIYDKEIEEKLADLIILGRIKVLKNEKFFELLEENYPIGLNRINWENVEGGISDLIDYKLINNENALQKKIKEFFKKVILAYPKIVNEKVVVFGDEALNQAYQMNFDLFQKVAMNFFSLPQHTYVLTKISIKCINFTFEGEFYFG
jgi:hypothetical protein